MANVPSVSSVKRAAIDAVQDYAPTPRLLKEPGNMKERRLSGTGRTNERDSLAVINLGAGPAQDVERTIALGVCALKADDLKHRLRPREIAHHFGHAASA